MRQRLLHGYIALASVAALALIIAWTIHGQLRISRPMLTATFVVLLFIGELLPLHWKTLDENGAITTSWSFALALLLLERPLIAVLAIVIASVAADRIHRLHWTKSVFNAAQLSLSVGAAGVVLMVTGQREGLFAADQSVSVGLIASILLAGLVLLLVNGLMISIVFALSGEVRLLGLLREGLLANAQTDGALLALAPALVVVSSRSLWLLPLALLTALLIYRGASTSLAHERKANHDSLTGLLNRGAFVDRLTNVIEASRQGSSTRALILLDLDGFKSINDSLGHQVGDKVLREVADRITALHGPGQFTSRLGGDEFATMVLHLHSMAEARDYAERLHEALRRPFESMGFPVQMSASIGVSLLTDDMNTADQILDAADLAMYSAKRTATGVETRTSRRDEDGFGRLELMEQLSGALDRGELFLEYQPQISSTDGHVEAVEALIRWQHPRFGRIEPTQFMHLAEQTELMQPLTDFVVGQALADLAALRAAGEGLRMAVNVSAKNLVDYRFPERIAIELGRWAIPGSALELEVTESAMMTNSERTASVIGSIRDLGARIMIDDFGTGHSSLQRMRDIPLDGLKIDRTFVDHLNEDHQNRAIVHAIVDLAKNLGLSTIAEGVETAASWRVLCQMGCDSLQGFLVARPMGIAPLASWLRTYDPVAIPAERRPSPPLRPGVTPVPRSAAT
jgi:diguanylate cyclase (GGDEF)-like protein